MQLSFLNVLEVSSWRSICVKDISTADGNEGDLRFYLFSPAAVVRNTGIFSELC